MVILVSKISLVALNQCPHCSSSLTTQFLVNDYESKLGEFKIDWCGKCNIWVTNPTVTKESIPLLYETRETTDFPEENRLISFLRGFAHRSYIARLSAFIPTNNISVLDWGCGDGKLSEAFSHKKWVQNVVALDFHKDQPQVLMHAPKAKYLPFSNFFSSESELFDVIIARHVLEHDLSPKDLIKHFEKYLTPEGIVIVEVPSFDTVWLHIFGGRFFSWYVPRHLTHFTKEGLIRAFGDSWECRVLTANTPVMGGSFGNVLGKKISNLGLLGLFFYPLQVALDKSFKKSTTFICIATKK